MKQKKNMLKELEGAASMSKNYGDEVIYRLVANIMADEFIKYIIDFSKHNNFINRKDMKCTVDYCIHKFGSVDKSIVVIYLMKDFDSVYDLMANVEPNDYVDITDSTFKKIFNSVLKERINKYFENDDCTFKLKYDKNKKKRFLMTFSEIDFQNIRSENKIRMVIRIYGNRI